ncbi:hypothetical protein FQR65_LT03761 [Abscondita terminalis]|nr:hypothetical protein FQR65_LT03761 [Abscondita terminalis]
MSSKAKKIWKEFERRRHSDGKLTKFWLESLREEHVEEVIELLKTKYLYEEPLSNYFKSAEDEVTMKEAEPFYRHIMLQGYSIVCMTIDDDGNEKLAGFSINTLDSIDKPKIQATGVAFNKILGIVEYLHSIDNEYRHYGVSEFLSDKGLHVVPDYRGYGIATEYLKCWLLIAKEHNVKVVGGTFTSQFSQASAKKAGFTELVSRSYAELRKINPDMVPDNIEEHSEYIKIFCKSAEDEVSMKEVDPFYRHIMLQGYSIVCMTIDDDGNEKLAGNWCRFNKILSIVEYLHSIDNEYRHYGVSEFLSDKGLHVIPDYRGYGIATEYLKCWLLIAKEHNVKVVGGTFTSQFSQGSAKKAGFTELVSRSYAELRKINPDMVPDNIEEHSEYIKIFCKYAEDEVTMKEAEPIVRRIMLQGYSIVCMTIDDDGNEKLVGFNINFIDSKDRPKTKVTGVAFNKFLNIVEYIYNIDNEYNHFGVSEFLTEKGLYVIDEYRGYGIATEYLKCWLLIAKKHNIKAVGGTFTSPISQASAEKMGFTELVSRSYAELRKINPDMVPDNIEEHSEYIKIYCCKVPI